MGIPAPLSSGKVKVPVADADKRIEFPFKSIVVPGSSVQSPIVKSPISFRSVFGNDVTLLSGIPLEILNTVPTGVNAFPNWKVPPMVVFAPFPDPLTKPRSTAGPAVLSRWNTIFPPVKLNAPLVVTFNDPILSNPLPWVASVTVPPEILIPAGIPRGANVPPAVFSSLPAILTTEVPETWETWKTPSCCV